LSTDYWNKISLFNSNRLRVDTGRLLQKYRRFRRILQQAEGKLEMDFHLEVSYIRDTPSTRAWYKYPADIFIKAQVR
jgi:uncharacterized protein YktA (UPF0223 family)